MKFFIFAVVLAVCAYVSGEECCGGVSKIIIIYTLKSCLIICNMHRIGNICSIFQLPRRKVKVHDDHDPEIKVIYTGQPCECQKVSKILITYYCLLI